MMMIMIMVVPENHPSPLKHPNQRVQKVATTDDYKQKLQKVAEAATTMTTTMMTITADDPIREKIDGDTLH